ncbi:hypothetical protein [Actinacidiphila oryziradicis]|uniref:Uncharacterized protein n=1 Tax=Actinacidiphila oryziradicis TaxID=2571141 RepID=A0A4U0SV25_9ACTN|nr:hypothetical protein [Actinacidiphila oryziradicis]TKA13423.1 hypothetical protein FCI23_01650 [Actinacidiphila oryziradicis]
MFCVSVTDYGYDQPGEPSSSSRCRTTRLRRALAGCGLAADGIQVHHALEGAVLVRFRAGLPVGCRQPQPPPAAPDHSRSPGGSWRPAAS